MSISEVMNFQGSSLDDGPPGVVSSAVVQSLQPPLVEAVVVFSEPVNPTDARAQANYELRAAGPNGTFGDGDDIVLELFPRYVAGATQAVLEVLNVDGILDHNLLQLSVFGDSTVHDESGNALDGDGDGQAGGNFVHFNHRPALTHLADQVVDEESLLTFTASGSDDDGNALTFSLDATAPSGATIHPDTGLFTWTPTELQGPGIYAVTVWLSDDGVPGLSDWQTLLVDVIEVNQSPVIDPLDDVVAQRGETVSVTATASDDDGNQIHFSLGAAAPAGAAIDGVNGHFTWTLPLDLPAGTYDITVIATDDGIPVLSDDEVLRVIVIADEFPRYNAQMPMDVNNDGFIVAQDALIIINDLNRNGARKLPVPPVAPELPPPYLDTSRTNSVEPHDALLVINYLNRLLNQGEGQPPSDDQTHTAALDVAESRVEPISPDIHVADAVFRQIGRTNPRFVRRQPVAEPEPEAAAIACVSADDSLRERGEWQTCWRQEFALFGRRVVHTQSNDDLLDCSRQFDLEDILELLAEPRRQRR